MGTFRKLLLATKPIQRPSGEKKGDEPKSLPSSDTVSAESSARSSSPAAAVLDDGDGQAAAIGRELEDAVVLLEPLVRCELDRQAQGGGRLSFSRREPVVPDDTDCGTE